MSRRQFFIASLLLLIAAPLHAAAPRVVVSIAPIHSLVAGVMEGVAEPKLLVNSNSSPHGYLLKPSEVRSLYQADLIVWVGESVEGFLPRTLVNLNKDKSIIELMAAPGMKLLPSREGGVWESHHDDHHDQHSHAESDGHLWLDVQNAQMIVKVMMAQLSNLDSEHAADYRANGERMLQALDKLDQDLKRKLVAVSDVPYLVFHDAYHYLENAYGLNPVGAIMIDPEHKPGARRLAELRQRVQVTNARCVFSEPQFSKKLIRVVTEDTKLKSATLDPMGMGIEPGERLYVELMQNLAQGLVECLGD